VAVVEQSAGRTSRVGNKRGRKDAWSASTNGIVRKRQRVACAAKKVERPRWKCSGIAFVNQILGYAKKAPRKQRLGGHVLGNAPERVQEGRPL